MKDTKYKMAKLIANNYYYHDNPTYEDLLKAIYDNEYRTIGKCPAKLFIAGICESFVIKDINHANKLLSILKQVVQEALEMSGIELTFTDEDWENIKYVENTKWNKEKVPYVLSELKKGYMSQFFEI